MLEKSTQTNELDDTEALKVHKDCTDCPNVVDVANDFVTGNGQEKKFNPKWVTSVAGSIPPPTLTSVGLEPLCTQSSNMAAAVPRDPAKLQ